jgi:hypothetical protein
MSGNTVTALQQTGLSGISPAPDLASLYNQHRGKLVDKWPFYLDFYQRIFSPLRDKPVRLLEIGIQNGGSLELWRKYFPNAIVLVGCDIDPGCGDLVYDDPRIQVVVGDATDSEIQLQVQRHAESFDIIIDDGSHRSGDIVRAFCGYFPLLSDEGLYIMEDLHCSYWSNFEGGLFHPVSSIAFAKCLADALHHEHWRLTAQRRDLLQPFFDHYRTSLSEDDLAHIQAVELANSVCVVRKAAPVRNSLGQRSPVGDEFHVTDAPLRAQRGELPDATEQSNNPWSSFAHLRRMPTAALLSQEGRPRSWLRHCSSGDLLATFSRLIRGVPPEWDAVEYVATHGAVMGPFWSKRPKLHYLLFAREDSPSE